MSVGFGHERYEVIALRYGTVVAPKSHLFYRFDEYHEPDAPQKMDYFFWVLRSSSRTIVVDCGFDPAVGERRGRTTTCPPAKALEAIGVSPSDVDGLVLTHLHYDHIGNLALFPNVDVTADERELEFWLGPFGSRGHFAASVESEELEAMRQALRQGRMMPIGPDTEIAPGVRTLRVGGHTPGQQIVLVQGVSGPVVLASDAAHFYEEIEADRPFGIFSDLEQLYNGYDLLRDLGQEAVVVPGHDPQVAERFPSVEGDATGIALRIS